MASWLTWARAASLRSRHLSLVSSSEYEGGPSAHIPGIFSLVLFGGILVFVSVVKFQWSRDGVYSSKYSSSSSSQTLLPSR